MATKIATLPFGSHAPVLPVLAGVPTDADFVGTPSNGTMVIGDGDIYVRVGGAWQSVSPA